MCLSVVDSVVRPLIGFKCLDPERYWDGVKEQYVESNKVNAPCQYSEYMIGEWNMSREVNKMKGSDGKQYYIGFHIFKTKEAAKSSGYGDNVYKVEYLGELSKGKEDGRVVVTALAMRVVEKVVFNKKKKVKKVTK